MRLYTDYILTLASSSLWTFTLAQDVPSAKAFLRRSGAAATVLGDYVYFDGGELSQWVDDKETDHTIAQTVNSTLSIDLSKSWSPDSVEIRTISKSGPRLMGQGVWPDADGGSFYVWGGHSKNGQDGKELTTTSVWRFLADGEGAGSWTKEMPANPEVYDSFQLSEGGAYATAHNTGFWIGGVATGWTQFRRGNTQPISGMASFNMADKTWRNDTAFDVSNFGTLSTGTAEYVADFGPNGLIFVLGGATYTILAGDRPPDGYRDFRNLTFFDPVSREWYWQSSTGDIPSPRLEFCTVGVSSPDGTYEIFLLGGYNTLSGTTFEDLYVLSLPGFVWTKVDAVEGGPRQGQTCVVAGKRHMLVIGGMNSDGWGNKDAFPQGLGIFDLSELKWSTEYDADAADYVASDVVKDWYRNTGIQSVQWSSEATQELFSRQVNESQDETGSKSKFTNTGAIVGGVVGGLAVLGLIAAAIFLVRRRKQRRRTPSNEGSHSSGDVSLQNGMKKPIEIDSIVLPAELPSQESGAISKASPVELAASPVNRNITECWTAR
ncbi:hypothetical protein jhhlp_006964 [Lomentospora prolificans]|uniref:Kelch repeat protein n=1 Tax=Lomentospora prolificans TaxID=41688 RepID=A0A2N3N1A9_9PEZI|nr:hypothetical protein jhhlp_006964 [Lomentospora prolificans]